VVTVTGIFTRREDVHMPDDFTDKQAAFIQEYLIDLNATQAAIRAGYSADTAAQIGYENLRKPDIAQAIAEALAERSQRTQITQDYVLNTVLETIERCRQAVPVLDRKGAPVLVETRDGSVAPAYVFDAKSIINGAKLLGEHIGAFKQHVELTGKNGAPLSPPAVHVYLPTNGRD
jgi:phage terminase small subunit